MQSRSRQEFRHPLNHSCTPTPVTDGENVYAFFGDYGLVSYTLEGEDRWRTPARSLNGVVGYGLVSRAGR